MDGPKARFKDSNVAKIIKQKDLKLQNTIGLGTTGRSINKAVFISRIYQLQMHNVSPSVISFQSSLGNTGSAPLPQEPK